MAVPDYQKVMLPILEVASDEREHSFREVVDLLANKYGLTEEERTELLPSGTQAVFDNRIGWAKTYLKKAGLLEYPKRGNIKITERGKRVLAEKVDKLDIKYLRQFAEFNEFQNQNTRSDTIEVQDDAYINGTPEEIIDSEFQNLRKALADEILEKIRHVKPNQFERLVVELLVRMGYGGSIKDAGKAIGKSGDEGIDGTIKEDKLGLDIIYIQAKRWKDGNSVGRPEIQKFVGALAGQGAKKGIFITASSFSKEALEYVPKNETKIITIDGNQLSQLMIEYNLGVSTQQTYEIKKLDNDYFDEL